MAWRIMSINAWNRRDTRIRRRSTISYLNNIYYMYHANSQSIDDGVMTPKYPLMVRHLPRTSILVKLLNIFVHPYCLTWFFWITILRQQLQKTSSSCRQLRITLQTSREVGPLSNMYFESEIRSGLDHVVPRT